MHEAKEPEKAGKVKCRAKKVGNQLNYNSIQARVMVGAKVPQTAYVICIIKHLPGGLLRSNTRMVCVLVVGNLKCHSLCTRVWTWVTGQTGIRKSMYQHRFPNPCLSGHPRPYPSSCSTRGPWITTNIYSGV